MKKRLFTIITTSFLLAGAFGIIASNSNDVAELPSVYSTPNEVAELPSVYKAPVESAAELPSVYSELPSVY
jgi:hypothetical protein